MFLSRRDFLKACAASAAVVGISQADVSELTDLFADRNAGTVIWLHGSGCQGDSISLLNLYSSIDPVGQVELSDVLLDHANLAYHTVLMASAGPTAVNTLKQAKEQGNYVLVLEGGVPTAFEGKACLVYSDKNEPVTYQQAVEDLAGPAQQILSVGTCACYGGIVASGPDSFHHNPTDVMSVSAFLNQTVPGKFIMNIPGCPAHPAWTTWGLVQAILGRRPDLDPDLRPVALFGDKSKDRKSMNIHKHCSRHPSRPDSQGFAETFGEDFKCLEELGCRGPTTYADCPTRKWHSGPEGPVNWCVDCNGMCLGCVEPDFPGGPFYT